MNSLQKSMTLPWGNSSRTNATDSVTSSQNQSKIEKKSKKKATLSAVLQKTAAFGVIALLLAAVLFTATDNLRYDLILSQRTMLTGALLTTLYVSVITLIVSMITGFGFFLAMNSSNVFIKTLTNLTKELVMGTPLLVMIFLVVYVLGIKIHVGGKLVLGIAALVLYMTPYIANAYETASAVVDRDQYTVMNLYHFTTWQKYRYVVIPQMIRPLIPSMVNNLSSIVKGSALLKIISVSEISYVITVISNKNYAAIEGYLVMWIMYLIITIPLSILARELGRRYGS